MRRRGVACLPYLCVAALAVAAALCSPTAARAATVLRGINDGALPQPAANVRAQHLHEIRSKLRASVLRVNCSWSDAEPARGQYSDTDDSGYLYSLEQTVADAHALGLKVIVTMCYVPEWASDSGYWDDPPPGYSEGYQDFYPMSQSALADYQAFAQHLAASLAGKVLGYEAWNEPNLWPYIYPQRTGGDRWFSAHLYLKYLKAFRAGVRVGDPHAKVIAGSTAPIGYNDIYRTSPQSFARALAAAGAAPYFDVYSHHPYVPGGTGDMDPTLTPPSPGNTVALSNIGTLLSIFPTKPFYLTEYGFSTEPSVAFGPRVTEAQQAAYLTKAYALAAHHSQVKLLVWQPLQDSSPSGKPTDLNGTYSGLRRVNGTAKPAWYAFAGGNRITLATTRHARRGTRVRLRGAFTCASVGGVRGVRLLIERKVGAGKWREIGTAATGAGGAYVARASVAATERLRVVFAGVAASPVRLVVAK
jgi:hypothetical protein